MGISEPKDKYTIVVYGDSISRGIIFDDIQRKHALLLENFPNIVREKIKAIIHNAAKFGSTLGEGLQRLQNDVLKRNPDIVLIEFGGNDCDFKWDQIAENPAGEFQPNTDCSLFSAMLKELVQKLSAMDIVPVLVTLPPLDPERYFNWISRNSDDAKQNILKWMGSVSKIYSWQERYNAAILRVAEQTKTRIIDIRSAFLESIDYTKYLCDDGIHPNKEGHRLIADKILEYIKLNYVPLLNTTA